MNARLPRRVSHRAALAALALLGLSAARADEAPRETPLSPADELATFELADPRLTVELVASEPQVVSPVAIAWDADGALYAAEMIDYPLGPEAGRIRRLIDRDGDGRYEHASVFAEGLRFPNGVLAARGGVFVTAAPDLLFLKDTDGDGRADQRTVVLTGFGEGNQQLRANGLTWGLDHWIYGANGRSDGNLLRPGAVASTAVSIRGHDFRLRPDGSAVEATTGASQFGQAGDDWGNRFLSWNTIAVRQAVFDPEFVERNGRFAALAVRDLADPADTGQVFPKSPRPQTFNRERTDYFNALSGLTIFRGDALGPDYVGSALVGEALTNLVHRRMLMPDGASFVARRGEHQREFLAARDGWFHPVYLTTGPDGALYIVDFYRRWVEHPAFVAERLRGSVDWRQGAGHGRIWKVSRRENTWPPKPGPRLSQASTTELAGHLNSPNGWWRDTAARLLVERGGGQSAGLLRALVANSRLPQAKIHALATLAALGQLDDGTLLRGVEDAEPRVRRYAIKLAEPRLPQAPSLVAALARSTDTSHEAVRFQLALSLGAIEGRDKVAAMVRLADAEYRDPLISAAIIGSLGNSAGDFLAELLDTRSDWRRKPDRAQLQFLGETAAAAGGRPVECLRLVAPPSSRDVFPSDLAILAGVARGRADRGVSPARLADQPDAAGRELAAQLKRAVTAARRMAGDATLRVEYRVTAIEALGLVDADSEPLLVEWLDPRQDAAVQRAAAAALVNPQAQTAAAIFGRWGEWTTTTRRALGDALLRTTSGRAALVAALENEQVLPHELDAAVRESLLATRDEALRARLAPLLKSAAGGADRRQVVARFEPLASGEMGDRRRGAAVFARHCLTCHSLQGRGQRIGPDLSGISARPKETLVTDVFDPSRQVTPEYLAYTLVTTEGQVLVGLVVAESAAGVTLRRADGAQEVVARARIEELRSTGKSLMPEGLETGMSADEAGDLFAFLADPDARLFAPQE